MMVSLVLYIATLEGRLGQKIWPQGMYDAPAVFRYSYGRDFLLMVVAFSCSEVTGVCVLNMLWTDVKVILAFPDKNISILQIVWCHKNVILSYGTSYNILAFINFVLLTY